MLKWLNAKKGDIFLQAVLMPFLIWLVNWLAIHFVEPGPIRDIGFYVICIAAIAAACFLIVWRRKPMATGILKHAMVYCGGQAWTALQPHDPFLIVRFSFLNGSRSTVYIKEVHGHIKLSGRELSGEIDLMSGQTDISQLTKYELQIRQWISPESAKFLKTQMNDGVFDLLFDAVRVTVASRDAGMEKEEERLDLPPFRFGTTPEKE